MVGRAAFALERNGHSAGVRLSLDVERVTTDALMSWPPADLSKIEQHDHNRITEDGAEAVALAAAHQHRAWRVVRRMQREEHADWLLENTGDEWFAIGVRRLLELGEGREGHGTNEATLFALPHDNDFGAAEKVVGGARKASTFSPLYKAYLELFQRLFPA
jgi:hypothetical protein